MNPDGHMTRHLTKNYKISQIGDMPLDYKCIEKKMRATEEGLGLKPYLDQGRVGQLQPAATLDVNILLTLKKTLPNLATFSKNHLATIII